MMVSHNINLLKQLPFYEKIIKPKVKEFTNTKLLSELPYFRKPIKAKIKQLRIKKLLSEQPFYKQPIKKPHIKKKATMNYSVSYHFMIILIFQEKKGHLEGMPKLVK